MYQQSYIDFSVCLFFNFFCLILSDVNSGAGKKTKQKRTKKKKERNTTDSCPGVWLTWSNTSLFSRTAPSSLLWKLFLFIWGFLHNCNLLDTSQKRKGKGEKNTDFSCCFDKLTIGRFWILFLDALHRLGNARSSFLQGSYTAPEKSPGKQKKTNKKINSYFHVLKTLGVNDVGAWNSCGVMISVCERERCGWFTNNLQTCVTTICKSKSQKQKN